jgi:hypothetical protein
MTARQTFQTSVTTAVTSAETGGVSNLPGTPTPPGNVASWSFQSANAAYNAGLITRPQLCTITTALAGWRQEQINAAHSTLQATGDVGPV